MDCAASRRTRLPEARWSVDTTSLRRPFLPRQRRRRVRSAVHDRVAELVPRIREGAARTEAERRISTELLAALMDTGLFAASHLGDPDEHAAELLHVVHALTGACGSTGWLAAHAGATPWLVDLLPPQSRQALRGPSGADPIVAFSLDDGGRLVETDDGLRLTGRWTRVTGAAYAGWLVLCVRLPAAGAGRALGLVLVPVAECRLADSADTIGLSAIGACEVGVEDVLIPSGRWCALSGEHAPSGLLPIGAAAAMALLGGAQGALDDHCTQMRHRIDRTHGGEQIRTGDRSPTMIGRAATMLDAAQLLLQGPDVPDALPQDPYEHQTYAVNRAVQATELVFSSSASHALADDDPVARLWRDVRVGAREAGDLTARLRMLSV
ncbi:hypothetical protein FXB39_01365 [Nocardioides sp. BGMRC 2183]|nr:hypothetical protein FXB39_01365 [Nocardioides sp. BGMRC 2183]